MEENRTLVEDEAPVEQADAATDDDTDPEAGGNADPVDDDGAEGLIDAIVAGDEEDPAPAADPDPAG